MNVSKSTLDHQPKTDDSDPPPIVMKPGSNPSRLVLPISWEFSFSWWWWGTWLRWLFHWWPNSPRRLHVFLLSKLGPGVSLFWILHQCSKNWNHASERCFCLPLTWRNKWRTSPIQVRLTFPNCFLSFFFPRHFPPTKPLSIWWGETTKKQNIGGLFNSLVLHHQLSCKFPSLLYLYTWQNLNIDTKHGDLF